MDIAREIASLQFFPSFNSFIACKNVEINSECECTCTRCRKEMSLNSCYLCAGHFAEFLQLRACGFTMVTSS